MQGRVGADDCASLQKCKSTKIAVVCLMPDDFFGFGETGIFVVVQEGTARFLHVLPGFPLLLSSASDEHRLFPKR